jgi:uracil-DNA glycosylase
MSILICGEAYGKDEEQEGRPFVGASGKLLNQMLRMAGIEREECYVTNVLNLRPKPSNDIKNCCGPKAEGIQGLPPLAPGKYLRAEYKAELDRLYAEVDRQRPNLILALGATAGWAFLRSTGISKIRGSTAESPYGKVLPTFHPAAIMRDWSLRPIVIADLHKAKREAEFPEVRRPPREVWIEPNLSDIGHFFTNYIWPAPIVSLDIETVGDMITCVGLAPSIDRSIVIPFFDPLKPGKNYWPTSEEERVAWRYIQAVCERKRTLFQNGMYDIHFLWRTMGIKVLCAEEDTMLLHHALQPEMNKGLGFLGSIYTDEASWKLMRKSATLKREE